MKLFKKTVFLLLIFSLGSCFFNNKPPDTIEGVYIGDTYELHQSNNTLNGYQRHDTIYKDTMQLTLLENDTVWIKHKNVEWKFVPDSNNFHMVTFGSHAASTFQIIPYDTLIVRHHSYGGYGGSFNQTDISFTGIKQ